jgi:hypothetical protein
VYTLTTFVVGPAIRAVSSVTSTRPSPPGAIHLLDAQVGVPRVRDAEDVCHRNATVDRPEVEDALRDVSPRAGHRRTDAGQARGGREPDRTQGRAWTRTNPRIGREGRHRGRAAFVYAKPPTLATGGDQ